MLNFLIFCPFSMVDPATERQLLLKVGGQAGGCGLGGIGGREMGSLFRRFLAFNESCIIMNKISNAVFRQQDVA
jgi:hypothetical protein